MYYLGNIKYVRRFIYYQGVFKYVTRFMSYLGVIKYFTIFLVYFAISSQRHFPYNPSNLDIPIFGYIYLI